MRSKNARVDGSSGKSRTSPSVVHSTVNSSAPAASDRFGDFEAGSAGRISPVVGIGDPPAGAPPRRRQPLVPGQGAADYSLVEAHSPTSNIRDDDPARAQVTRLLIQELAPLLGIDPGRVVVNADRQALRRLAPRRATGLQEHGEVFLHPDRYRPQEPAGRYLVAHELAHLAQRRVDARGDRKRQGLAGAEREAHEIARAFVRRQALPRPAVALVSTLTAEHSGDVTTAATAVTCEATKAEPSLDDQRRELDGLVAQTRSSELARMIDLLSYGLLDWAVTDDDVTEVLRILMTLNMVGARSLVAALPIKYRHRLLDNLDTDHYKHHRAEVLAVYWGSSRDELRSFSGELQKAFETMDLRRLDRAEASAAQYALKNIDDAAVRPLRNGKRRDEIEAILAFVPDEREEARLLKEQLQEDRSLQAERAAAEDAFTRGPRANDLAALVRQIAVQISDPDFSTEGAMSILEKLMPYAFRKAELRAIADHLSGVSIIPSNNPKDRPEYEERFDYLDRLIRQVRVEDLYGNARLQRMFFLLLTFRPAYKNSELAEELTNDSRFILVSLLMKALVDPFTDRVTSEDAYLAFLLVKAMPASSRRAFFSIEGGERWKLVMTKLSQQQRESEALNLYSGGRGDSDRNALLSQLLADDVWKPEATGRLDGLIRLAITAGEHEFVFTLSRQRKAYASGWLKPYVDKYKLFDPEARDRDGKTRTEYSPELLEGTPWYTRGYLFGGISTAWQGFDFIFSSKNVEVATKSVGGEGLNLVELQDLFGGNFMGVRFRELSGLGHEGEAARRDKKGVNFANVKWDTGRGVLTMDTPKLEIEAIRYPIEDFEFQSSRGTIQGLNLELRYGTGDRPKPSLIDVNIDQLTLHDVALISPDSMKSANQLGVSSIHMRSDAPGSESGTQPTPRGGLKVPIPIVGIPLGGAWNLFLGSMWNSLLGLFKVQSHTGISGGTAELANMLDAGTPMGFRFEFGSVNLLGSTTSGGQYIESMSFTDVVIQGGGDPESYRVALTASIERIDKRLAALRETFGRSEASQRDGIARSIRGLQTQRDHTQAELEELTATEREVARLEALQAKSPASFGTQERLQLRRLKSQLSGAVLDVGHVGIKGIAGVSKGEFSLENVHGSGRSVNAALSLLTNSDRLKSFITGAEGRPVIAGADKDQDQFTLDIGHVELPPLRIVGAIPTAEAARKDFERFESSYEPWRQNHRDEHARLKRRMDLAKQRGDLLADPGISGMSEPQQAQFRAIERELEEIEARASLTVGRVVMEGARLGIAGDERISVGAEQLLVEDMRKGNMRVARIEGSNVVVGVDVHDGIAGLDEWRKNLRRIGIKGESVIATDITNDEIGLSVDRATLMGVDEASLDVGERNASARITTKLVLVEGVRLRNMEGMLVNERDHLAGLTARTAKQQRQLDGAEAALKALAALRTEVSDAEAAIARARRPKEKAAAQGRRDTAQHELDRWAEGMIAKSLAVSNLDVDVTGLGDVLSNSFDLTGALAGGIGVHGRGGAGGTRMFSGATGVDVGIPGLTASRIGLGETSGEIFPSDAGTNLRGIHIDTIAAQGIEWRDGQRHAFSRGETRLQGVDVSAFIGDRQIVVSTLECAAITADQLGYEDESTGLSAVVESGGLGGISITNLTVDLPQKQAGTEEKTEAGFSAGKINAQSANDLKVNALIGGIGAKGTLNGSNLSVEFVTDRKRVYRVGDLRMRAGEITEPGTPSNLHVSFRGLKGTVTQETLDSGQTQYTFDGIGLGAFEVVGRSLWAGSGWRIEVGGGASLRGVTLDAVALQEKKSADGRAGKLSQFTLTDLRVAQMEANDVAFQIDAVAPDPKKPGDPGSPATSTHVSKATILDLAIRGIDLKKKLRDMTGKVEVRDSIDVQKLRIAVGDAGKDQIVSTLSFKAFGSHAKNEGLRGRELSAQLFGPDGNKINLGTITEISGDFEGLGARAAFSTGRITMSPVEISGDGREARVSDVTVDSVHLDAPTYSDGKGTDIKLGGANARKIHIEGVVATFGEVTEPSGKKSQGMTNLDIRGLRFEFIDARGFNYSGKTTLNGGDTKDRTVTADKAELADLQLDRLSRDFNTRITTLKNARLAKTTVTGFVAAFAETISGKTSQTEITGNVEAEAMHAELILTGTRAVGEDWTSIDGLFELADPTRGLGLTNVHIVHKAGTGGKLATTFELGVDPGKTGGFDLKGLKVHFAPNGTLYVEFASLEGKKLHIVSGSTKVDIDLATLKTAAAGLQGPTPDQAFDVLGATLADMQVSGVTATIDKASAGSGASPSKSTTDRWVLGALGSLDGSVGMYITDAVGPVDADISVPISKGVIDCNKVVIEVVGPNANLGVDSTGIYIDSITGREYKYEHSPIPGAKLEKRRDFRGSSVVTDRGSLDLKMLLEDILNSPPAPSSGGGSSDQGTLNRAKLKGDLGLGAGPIGTTKNNIEVTGHAGTKNRMTLDGVSLGKELTISLPEFQAARSTFEIGEKEPKTVTTGPIDANVHISVEGIGGTIDFKITLTVIDGKVRDIRFGNVTLASQAAMRALPAPPKEK